MRSSGIFFLMLALITAGCERKPSDDFPLFEEHYFNALFEFQPTAGTLAGLHDFDRRLEDYSRTRIESRITELEAMRVHLRRVRAEPLSTSEALDAEVLEAQLEAELFDHTVTSTWKRNPMGYVSKPSEAVDAILKRSFAPGRERLPSVIARLEQTPELIESMKRNIENPAREFTEIAIPIARSSADYFRDAVTQWARLFATVDEMERLDKAVKKAQFAMEDAARWLENDLLPRSHGTYALGVQNFARKLALEEMVDVPLGQLLRLGEATLRADEERFRKVAARIAPGRRPEQVMAGIADEHPRADELLEATRRTLDRTRSFLIERDLISLTGDAKPRVTDTPPFLRSGLFAAMDTPGSFETRATEAYYYVTPVERQWDDRRKREHLRLFNRPVLEVITIHEAFPGHYVQFLNASRFPTRTRKLVSVSSNAEGWAHYAEQMMIEEGYGNKDPKLELAQLSEALLRDCRFIAGIKLHTEGMTVDQATRFFVEHGFQEPANAFEEARRGTYNPTYLYYTLGKLMVYRLRADFEREQGSSYKLKEFHDRFIRQGAMPIKMMRRLMLSSAAANGPLL